MRAKLDRSALRAWLAALRAWLAALRARLARSVSCHRTFTSTSPPQNNRLERSAALQL